MAKQLKTGIRLIEISFKAIQTQTKEENEKSTEHCF